MNVGGTSCACGGTHVKNTSDIRGVLATKIKKVNIRKQYLSPVTVCKGNTHCLIEQELCADFICSQ